MNINQIYRKVFGLVFTLVVTSVFVMSVSGAAVLSPTLQRQLPAMADSASAGVVIVSFKGQSGLTTGNILTLQSLGVTKGVTFQRLGMVATVLTAGQIRSLAANSSVRSIWSNDRQQYLMHQARVMTGVDRLTADAGFTLRNGGMPVFGKGDFSVFVIDSGIDATHADLPFGTKVIQNTQRVVSTDTGNTGITIGGVPLNGFTPSLSIENVPNTDTVGHGTHVAGIVGGLGTRSGGSYGGVAPGTGRYFESSFARYGFTSAMVAPRAIGNFGLSSGLNSDTELPAGMIPFYTQISGTSMATPFTAGVVALMLDADPTLTPDEIKQILTDTTTKMPGYQDYEVGAGYLNAYAAVDKVYNRGKGYQNFSNTAFNATFGEERPPVQNYHIDYDPAVSGAGSTNSKEFTVEPNMSVLEVSAQVDTLAEEGTGNFVGVRLYDPNGVSYGATSIPTPVLGSDIRETTVNNPVPGTWRMEVRGASGLAAAPVSSPRQIASPGPVEARVTQVKYILPVIPDIQGHPKQAEIESALKNRVIDTYNDGSFRPDSIVNREDLARSLTLNTPLRQTLGLTPKFTDVTGDLARIAEAATAKGSTLRDYNFVPTGMMSSTGSTFNPAGNVNRIDVAVALVKALGYDAEARALAGSNVTFNGTTLSDNGQIPSDLRGYVQIAINKGLFEAFPAEIRQIGPGQFQAIPGPRFEPASTLTRATFAGRLNAYRQLFWTGG